MNGSFDAERWLDFVLDRTIGPGYSRVGFVLRPRGWPDDDPRSWSDSPSPIT
ncbi:hypothetical protein ACQP1G_30160 [Nocardia sp. CA-107356]|uniref:hypothetical protein n=1 Tax=Nocardia sp. CA-107356 TaxID=3239972 RepID=UPI003D90D008